MREGAYFYRAHGLVIRSAFPIPELQAWPTVSEPDIDIRPDPAVRDMVDRAARSAGVHDTGVAILRAASSEEGGGFAVKSLGAFWVRAGREIRVALDRTADQGLVTLYLLGTAMGLALFQRGALVLHGASLAHRERATLFLGPSGAGKSTLAARLGQAGFPILGDDTAALWSEPESEEQFLHPAGTSFKLWRDALEAAGFEANELASVGNRIEKFYLANPRRAEERPHALEEIIILGTLEPGEEPRIERLSLLEAVSEICANAYRPQFVEVFGGIEEQFRRVTQLAGRVPVSRLLRPWNHAATGAVAELLRCRLEGGGPAMSGGPGR